MNFEGKTWQNGWYLKRRLRQRALCTPDPPRWLRHRFLSTILSTKMTSSMGAIYQDDFVNGCYLPRWLRQRVLSTLADFVNRCYLPILFRQRVLSSLADFTNRCYLPRWLPQQVLSTKMTSSTGAFYQDYFVNGCYLQRWLRQLCYLPRWLR